MKKILAILLVIIMVLPMAFSASAAESAEALPFYFVNMGGLEFESEYKYCYDMPFFWSPAPKPGQPVRVAYDGGGGEDIPTIAVNLKKTFDNQPEGSRYIRFDLPHKAFNPLADYVVYVEPAKEAIYNWLSQFLEEYSRIGGMLDGIIVDVEYENIESYYLYRRVYSQDKTIYQNIVDDPRYEEYLRPMLEERGFKFYDDPTGEYTEIWGISGQAGSAYSYCQTVWDNVAQHIMADAINESVLEPLLKYYPDGIVSDYQTPDFKGWLKHFYDNGSVKVLNAPRAGNSSNFNTYNNRIGNGIVGSKSNPNYSNIVGYNKAVFGSEPFNMTMWDVNMFRKIYEATDTGVINAWIANYNSYWGSDKTCTTNNTPYYTETLYHMGMMAMNPSFVGYVVSGGFVVDEDDWDAPTTSELIHDAVLVIDDILAELTRVAGYADRKIIPMPVNWNGGYVLSGMYAGGRNIWRITPNTEMVSLKDFKVKDDAPTFCVDGLTITFPQGKIIADGDVRTVGSCGYWVETPADVMPVITAAADRYAEHPAFEETFEQYDVGTVLTPDTAAYKNVWQVGGFDLKVETNGSNKALAMTRTSSLTNVKLPQNVTAGDSYAKQQAWEVSFTLPADLDADALLTLLTCAEGDGGIRISGGKMYYDQTGTYKELSGVSLSAGTYTVKREVDFRTSGAFTSSYTIYDSTGKLLGEVKDIPMAAVSLPVTGIKIACKNVNSKILIDNYKIYPTGVTTDFELYDAKIGNELTDLDQVRTADTAYRLAWMNATNENQIAYVYNVKNGDVIKKVEMPAGQDGVITGVVAASSDAAVQLAVRTETDTSKPPVTDPDTTKPVPTDPTDPDVGPAGGLDMTVVIVIVVAALVAVALALVFVSKKPKKKVVKVVKVVKKKTTAPETVETDEEHPSEDTAE